MTSTFPSDSLKKFIQIWSEMSPIRLFKIFIIYDFYYVYFTSSWIFYKTCKKYHPNPFTNHWIIGINTFGEIKYYLLWVWCHFSINKHHGRYWLQLLTAVIDRDPPDYQNMRYYCFARDTVLANHHLAWKWDNNNL